MRNNATIYERQKWLKESMPQSVAVVGCGGVGSWTAYLLAMAGVPELWLFDHDAVSEHNLNRLPVPPSAIGQSKSAAVAALIATVRPDCRVLACGGFDQNTADAVWSDGGADWPTWLVVTTDTLASRQMCREWCKKCRVNYMEAAAEGEYGSVTGEPAEWSTEAETLPGYASVPVWVGPAIFAATMAVAHVVHGVSCGDDTYRVGWDLEQHRLDIQQHVATEQADDDPICDSCGRPASQHSGGSDDFSHCPNADVTEEPF